MSEAKEVQTVATNIVTIKGKAKSWPDKFDGLEVQFPTLEQSASLDDALAFLKRHAESETAIVDFIRTAIERDQPDSLRSHLNGKDVPPGTSRAERAKAPQRSETMKKDDVLKFPSTTWKITENRRASSTTSKVKAAEAAARREREAKDAATEALLDTLRDLPKKDAAERFAKLQAAGVIPEGVTL